MGYYTQFSGYIYNPAYRTDCVAEAKIAEAIAHLPYFDWFYTKCKNKIPKTIDEVIQGENKWYSWEKDMKDISKQFPDTTICLHGEGEDREDMWYAYFKNGKEAYYKAEITYPDYYESDLQ